MTKYTVSIDFDVEAKDKFQAENFAEIIQNIVAAYVEDDNLYLALSDSELTGIYKDDEEDEDD